MFALTKLLSVLTPVTNKLHLYYDLTKEALCYVDEYGAQWFCGHQRCGLSADLTGVTVTTLADVTGMVFPLRANKRYAFEFNLVFRSTDTTTGLKVALTTPASPTVFAANVRIPSAADGTGSVFCGTLKTSGDVVTSPSQEEANVDYIAEIRGRIANGANAGNLQLQWAAEVGAAGTVTPKAGSSGRLWLA